MPEPTVHKTLRDFLRPVFRWWWLFSIGVAVAALAVLVLTPTFWPVKYTATTKFLQQVGVASENLTAGKSESFDVRKQTLGLDLIGSRALNEVFDELEKKYPMFVAPRDDRGQLTTEGLLMRAQLVAKLTPDLKVAHEVRSEQRNVVSVAFTSSDPGLAQELSNKIVELYIRRTLKDFLEGLTRSKEFLEMEKNKAGGELEKLVADKNAFESGYEKQYGLPFPDSAGGLEEAIRRVEDKIESTQNDRKNAQRSLERLKAYQERHGNPVPAATKTPDAAEPATPATAAAPAKPGEAAPPAKPGEAAPPAKPGEAAPPAKPGEAAPPAKPGEAAPPADPAAVDHELEQAFRTAFLEQKRLEEDLQKYKRSLDEARTLSHMTDKHPTIVAMKKQLADNEKQIADTQKTLVDLEKRRRDQRVAPTPNGEPLLDPTQELARRQAAVERDRAEMVRLEMEDTQNQIKDTDATLQRQEKHVDGLKDFRNRFGSLKQERDQIVSKLTDKQAEMARWQKQLSDLQMALATEYAARRTILEQVELAPQQTVPSSPKLWMVLGLAAGGAIAFGTGLVFLANLLDRTIATTEDAEQHFGLPVLGVVSEILTPQQRMRRRLILVLGCPTLAMIVLLGIGVASLNMYLWLEDRDGFQDWRSSPTTYLSRHASDGIRIMKSHL